MPNRLRRSIDAPGGGTVGGQRQRSAAMNLPPNATPPPAWRRLFHFVAASATTLLAFAIPEPQYMAILGGGALLSLALETGRFRVGWLNHFFLRVFAPILKTSETAELTGATYFLIAAFFAFYFFGLDVAIPVLLFVSVGDPVAALVGMRAPGPRLWRKSPVGSAAFVVAALAIWAVVSALGYGQWTWAVVATACVAAAVELAPIPVDDNLTIPLLAGAIMTLLTLAGL